jgi:collagen triple helix repeat protein
MKFVNKRVTPVVAGAAILVALGGVGGAFAGQFVTSAQIKDQTIQSRDIDTGAVASNEVRNGSLVLGDLSVDARNALKGQTGAKGATGATGAKGDTGAKGADGKDGKDGLSGAVYRVENYTNGGGGDATVACADDEAVSKTFTAIAGGVQAGHTGSNDFAVTASYPGRMDWDTGEPKPNRLDGWIVLGNGKYTDNLKVWALCVPNTSIGTDVVDLDN